MGTQTRGLSVGSPALAPHKVLHLVALGLLAVVAALPRFGQRENEGAELSDSDYYLDMSQVFAGRAEAFDQVYSAPGHPGSKHYARPLLPILAGQIVRVSPISPRAALSTVSLLAAWLVAAALYLFLAAVRPEMALAWLPSALFLTGFPQVNWGYHILSDTLGYATAFLASVAVWAFLRWHNVTAPKASNPVLWFVLLGIWALQALAFLARETAWFTPVVLLALVAREGRWRSEGRAVAAVLAVLLLAKLPHALYMAHFGVEAVGIPFAPDLWLDPLYLADFLVKSAVAFHLAWLLALASRTRATRPAPDLLVAWRLAALLYMAAGYAHNSREGIGYPLRLTYALFPMVFYLAAQATEAWVGRPRPRIVAALLLVLGNAAVAATGVALDPGGSVIIGAAEVREPSRPAPRPGLTSQAATRRDPAPFPPPGLRRPEDPRTA